MKPYGAQLADVLWAVATPEQRAHLQASIEAFARAVADLPLLPAVIGWQESWALTFIRRYADA